MKPTKNEEFIVDCGNPNLSSETIRQRFKDGYYGAIRADYAKGWWANSGRK